MVKPRRGESVMRISLKFLIPNFQFLINFKMKKIIKNKPMSFVNDAKKAKIPAR